MFFFCFFFYDTATTEIYTLSLHDALPISDRPWALGDRQQERGPVIAVFASPVGQPVGDRKSTRLNSSHVEISYAVFCLKKKNQLPVPAAHHAGQQDCLARLTAASARLHSRVGCPATAESYALSLHDALPISRLDSPS